MKASNSIRSFAPKEIGFKCKCGHTEAWEYPTHSTCKKCALVKDKIHQGKAYRDIRERADLNGVGMTHDTMMSHGYNVATVPKQNADPTKRATETLMKKMVRGNRVHVDTKDKHILSAKAEFEEREESGRPDCKCKTKEERRWVRTMWKRVQIVQVHEEDRGGKG